MDGPGKRYNARIQRGELMSNERLLEDVLSDFGYEARSGDAPRIFGKYAKKYPNYYDELREYAVSLALLNHVDGAELSEDEQERYRLRGVEQLRAHLKKKPASVSSLTLLAKENGMDKRAFAAALGISISLLMYLEKRRLEVSSIPRRFVEMVAETLKTTEDSVAAYLAGGPELSHDTSFKSETRPEVSGQKDFLEVVKEDPGLTDRQRETLLNLI